MRLILAVAVLTLPTAVSAAPNWADVTDYADLAQSKQICARVRAVAIADPERPDRRAEGGMPGCSSEALYYGIGVAADPKAAFACAGLEPGEMGFGGDTMLMTMYANGKGAQPDLDKAIAIACVQPAAPAETHGRVLSLAARRGTPHDPTEFHWCDDVTSGYATGLCASHGQRIAAARREARWRAIRARWPNGEAARRLDTLLKAGESFAAIREREVDQSGTMRGALVVAAEEEVLDTLQGDLDRMLAADDPKLAQAIADSTADAELNAAYQRYLKLDFGAFAGSPTRDGIRAVQRQWLKYRDAWTAFVAAALPDLDRRAMINLQTRHRVDQIKDLMGE